MHLLVNKRSIMLESLSGVSRMSQHNNLNWKDFLLCLGMELAFGDGSRDEQVYRKIENIMSRMEYY